MKNLFRKLAFTAALAGLALAFDVSLVSAQTTDSQQSQPASEQAASSQSDQTVRKPSYRVHKKKAKKTKGSKVGGKKSRVSKDMGLTKAEIKKFQREHGLKADGILGPKTLAAMEVAKKAAAVPMENPKILGSSTIPTVPQEYAPDPNPEINQDQTPPLNGGSKIVFSRFGHIDLTDNGGAGADRRYSISLNGQQVLDADGQPSIVGVSKAYELDNEDAVVITAYNTKDALLCAYRNFVLVLSPAGGKLLELNSCSRDYQAHVSNNSLFVVYPDQEDDRAVGATWRLEGQTLTKL